MEVLKKQPISSSLENKNFKFLIKLELVFAERYLLKLNKFNNKKQQIIKKLYKYQQKYKVKNSQIMIKTFKIKHFNAIQMVRILKFRIKIDHFNLNNK